MRFGPVPLDEAAGAVLAHSVRLADGRLRKGRVLDADAVARLRAGGVAEVVVARLDAGEVGEDEAAGRLAAAMAGPGLAARAPFTGRANLHAEGPGVLEVDAAAVDAANAIDPMLTVATLPRWQRVAAGTMAATVKVIAFGVADASVASACAVAGGALRLRPPAIREAALIVTTLDGAPTGARAVTARLERLGIACAVREVAHEAGALAVALAGTDAPLRLILTASATSDVADVGPSALLRAGGRLERFGMPVDPGNLLFLGRLGGGDGDRPAGLRALARAQRGGLGDRADRLRGAGDGGGHRRDGRRRAPGRDPDAAAAPRAAAPRGCDRMTFPRRAHLCFACPETFGRTIAMTKVTMTVNGRARTAEAEGRTLLVDWLREGLRLTGTHVGCDTSQCGACVVHLDGEPVKACTVLAQEVDGSEVTTIEGMANADGSLGTVQQAFQDYHGLQCGFCTPGMVMAAASLLKENPRPSEAEVRHYLEGNICRCTGYHNIVKAVMAASGQQVAPVAAE